MAKERLKLHALHLRPMCRPAHRSGKSNPGHTLSTCVTSITSSASRLSLVRLLLCCLLLLFLFRLGLLLLVFSLVLSDIRPQKREPTTYLQGCLLFCSLRYRLEKSFQSCLLSRLYVLLQPLGCVTDSILVEALFRNKEVDETFDIRSLPLEITVLVVGGTNIGIEKQLARILVGPIVWYGIFLLRVLLN